MFASRYWPDRYFAPHYWCKVGSDTIVVTRNPTYRPGFGVPGTTNRPPMGVPRTTVRLARAVPRTTYRPDNPLPASE